MPDVSPEMVEIACPRCKVRISVSPASVGTTRQCPECRLDFLLTGGMLRIPATEAGGEVDLQGTPAVEDTEEEYALQTPISPPEPLPESSSPVKAPPWAILSSFTSQASAEARSDQRATAESREALRRDEELDEEEAVPAVWNPTKPPPRMLFMGGLASFFASAGIWLRGAGLGLGMLAVLWLVGYGLFLSGIPVLGAWIGSMLFFAIGGVLGIAVLMMASAYALAVLRDSADGLAAVESWPSGFLVDWGLETLYVACALLWGILPGGLISLLLPDLPRIVVYALGEAVFFPIMLLAAFDATTPTLPSSTDVWKSLFRCRFTWLRFYLLGIPLFVVMVVLGALALLTADFLLCILAGIVWGPGWILYFRWLGRLAWYCSGRFERGDVE